MTDQKFICKYNEDTYTSVEYKKVTIIMVRSKKYYNGYINASKICSTVDKQYSKWLNNKHAIQIIKELSKQLNIDSSELFFKIWPSNNNTEISGSYVHPMLITHIAYWISPKFSVKVGYWVEEWKKHSPENNLTYHENLNITDAYKNDMTEETIQSELHKKLGGKIEVKTPVGRIDLLTDDKLIEIKKYKNWLHGMGQLIGYSNFYPKKEKMLYLFNVGDGELSYVKKICKKHDVAVKVFD